MLNQKYKAYQKLQTQITNSFSFNNNFINICKEADLKFIFKNGLLAVLETDAIGGKMDSSHYCSSI